MKTFLFVILLLWVVAQCEMIDDCRWGSGNPCDGPVYTPVQAARNRILENQRRQTDAAKIDEAAALEKEQRDLLEKKDKWCVDFEKHRTLVTKKINEIDAALDDSTTLLNWFDVDLDISICVFGILWKREFDVEYHVQSQRLLVNFNQPVEESKFVTHVEDVGREHWVYQIRCRNDTYDVLRYFFAHHAWIHADVNRFFKSYHVTNMLSFLRYYSVHGDHYCWAPGITLETNS